MIANYSIKHPLSPIEHYDDKVRDVEQAPSNGSVDAALDPRNLVLALIGMVSWFAAAPQISQMIVGDVTDPVVIQQHRSASIEYARRIVEPRM